MTAKFSGAINRHAALVMLSLCGGSLFTGCTALPQRQVIDGGPFPPAQSTLAVVAEKLPAVRLEVFHNPPNASMKSPQWIGAPSEFSRQANVESPRSPKAGELSHQVSNLASEVSRDEQLSLLLKPKQVDLHFGKFTIGGSLAEVFSSRNFLNPLNPFVPRDYGAAEKHLARDFTTGRISGLRLFSFEF